METRRLVGMAGCVKKALDAHIEFSNAVTIALNHFGIEGYDRELCAHELYRVFGRHQCIKLPIAKSRRS